MIRAYAVSSVREAEAAAGVEEGELMSRAAAGLAAVASARLGGAGGRRVLAIVGAGNNGGDALYALASLARDGATVVVLKVAESVHEGGLRAARDAGGLVLNAIGVHADPAYVVSSALHEADLVIDGIVGIGGRPGLSPQIEGLLREVSDTAYVLAVDLPSGADPDGEVAAQSCVFADETVTFIAAKPVHLLPATEPAVGRLTVVDIGVEIGQDRWSSGSPRTTSRGSGRVPGRRTTSTPVACSASLPAVRTTRGRRCWRSPRRSARVPGWCVTSARRRRPCSFARRCPRPSSARARCRPGSSGPASTSATSLRRAGPSGPPRSQPWTPACPVSWMPAAST